MRVTTRLRVCARKGCRKPRKAKGPQTADAPPASCNRREREETPVYGVPEYGSLRLGKQAPFQVARKNNYTGGRKRRTRRTDTGRHALPAWTPCCHNRGGSRRFRALGRLPSAQDRGPDRAKCKLPANIHPGGKPIARRCMDSVHFGERPRAAVTGLTWSCSTAPTTRDRTTPRPSHFPATPRRRHRFPWLDNPRHRPRAKNLPQETTRGSRTSVSPKRVVVFRYLDIPDRRAKSKKKLKNRTRRRNYRRQGFRICHGCRELHTPRMPVRRAILAPEQFGRGSVVDDLGLRVIPLHGRGRLVRDHAQLDR